MSSLLRICSSWTSRIRSRGGSVLYTKNNPLFITSKISSNSATLLDDFCNVFTEEQPSIRIVPLVSIVNTVKTVNAICTVSVNAVSKVNTVNPVTTVETVNTVSTINTVNAVREINIPVEPLRKRITHSCNRAAIQAFFARPNLTDRTLGNFFRRKLYKCDVDDIASIMHLAGKMSILGTERYLENRLKAIATQLEILSEIPRVKCHPNNLAVIIYGLQNYSENDPGVTRMINAVVKMATTKIDADKIPSGLCLSMMYLGLQNNECKDQSTQKLLVIMEKFTRLYKEPITSGQAAKALHGMQNMNSNDPLVCNLIDAFTPLLRNSMNTMTGTQISYAISGMQNMTSDSPQVIKLLSVLTLKIEECSCQLQGFNITNIADIMMGLRGMNSDVREVRTLLKALTPLFEKNVGISGVSDQSGFTGISGGTGASGVFDRKLLSSCLNSMQRMSSDSVEVRKILSCLLPRKVSCKMDALVEPFIANPIGKFIGKDVEAVKPIMEVKSQTNSCEIIFTAVEISDALYGLQRMNSTNTEVRKILLAMTPRIIECVDRFNAEDVSRSLFGMQNMNNSYSEVRGILRALSPLIRECREQFSSNQMGDCLYGLRGMNKDSGGISLILNDLLPILRRSYEPLTPADVGKVLYGLQGITGGITGGNDRQADKILLAIIPNIRECILPFEPNDMCNALHGLKNRTSDPLVRSLLDNLSFKLKTCKNEFSAKEVSMSMYGLQGMSNEHSSVCHILQKFKSIVKKCKEEFSGRDIAVFLHGFKSVKGRHYGNIDPSISRLLAAFTPKLQESKVLGPQDFSLSLQGITGLFETKESIPILDLLYLQLSNYQKDSMSFQSTDSLDLCYLSQSLGISLPIMRRKRIDCKKWDTINTLLIEQVNNDSRVPFKFQLSALELRLKQAVAHVRTDNCWNQCYDKILFMSNFQNTIIAPRKIKGNNNGNNNNGDIDNKSNDNGNNSSCNVDDNNSNNNSNSTNNDKNTIIKNTNNEQRHGKVYGKADGQYITYSFEMSLNCDDQTTEFLLLRKDYMESKDIINRTISAGRVKIFDDAELRGWVKQQMEGDIVIPKKYNNK